jgi:hypothetical protein
MASNDITEDELLVERFIASFEKLGELTADEASDPIAWQLATGDRDQYGCKRWQPIKVSTEFSLLEPVYSKLPARFPRLFERLVLSYRWAEVDLQSYRLLANPPGPGLGALLREMSKDSIMRKCLLEGGYIQFGKGPDIDYDAICFDRSTGSRDDDCRIVKIDHEQILCNNRLKVVAELAPSFEQLMLRTIDKATKAELQ